MSQENVQIARENIGAFNRREIDAFLASLHPDVEWDDSDGFPGLQGVYRGRACGAGWKRSRKPGKASMAKSNRALRGAMAESSFRWLEPHAEGPVEWRPSFARGSSSG
jgi:ketosteroid isomerase-like protein